MDRHQAGQEEKLVKLMVAMDGSDVDHPSGGSPVKHRCSIKFVAALATVMGLVIVALVGLFTLHVLVIMQSCKQDALNEMAKTITVKKLNESDGKEGYDIFTIDKAATYLIYGWVRFSDVPKEEFTLIQEHNGDTRTIRKSKTDKAEIFFSDKIKALKDMRIRLNLKSICKDSMFILYELSSG